jgi:alkaline phosphatase D
MLPPRGSTDPVRIGFWTCQHFTAGYYAPHRALAAEELDLVVCLGDYIYEYGGDSALDGRDDGTGDGGTATKLEHYRDKYKLYRSDADLRTLHAQHAWHYLWDDHEVVNNYWREGSAGKTVEGFAERRAAAYRAWFEHQPSVRIGDGTRIYRSVRVGELADLFLLDTRQYRDAQPCGDSNLAPCPDAAAPGRTMLGAEQKAWLKDGMRRTTAAWKVVANGDMLMALDQPVRGASKFVDTWDGYTAEREELVRFWRDEPVKDVVVVTGDDHDNYAGVVTTTGRDDGLPGAVEFVVPSVTSDNTTELLANAGLAGTVSEADTRAVNPHLKLVDQKRHGYCVLELGRDEAVMEFKHVSDRTARDGAVSTTYTLKVPRGRPELA